MRKSVFSSSRVIALFLSMIMLLLWTVFTASAETPATVGERYYSKSWTPYVAGQTGSELYTNFATDNAYAAITANPSDVHSGKYAYKFVMPYSKIDNHYIDIRTPLTMEADVEYKITFYAKGTYARNLVQVGPAWFSVNLDHSLYEKEPQGDGWTKYTCVRTRTSTTNEFRIAVDGGCTEFIIDDVSVVATANPDAELLNNGGFEEDVYSAVPVKDVVGTAPLTANATNAATELKSIMGTYAYCGVTDREGETRTGNFAYKIVQPRPEESSKSIYITAPLSNMPANSTYVLSFYAKGVYKDAKIQVGFGDPWFMPADLNTSWTKSAPDANGWVKYTLTNAFVSARTQLRIDIKGDCQVMFIDDMSLTIQGSDTNLLDWGGFENVCYSIKKIESIKDSNWTQYIVGDSIKELNAEDKAFMQITNRENEVHSGKFAYKFVNQLATQIANNYIDIRTPLTMEANVEYKITFYAKGIYQNSKIQVGPAWFSVNLDHSLFTKEKQADGWTKYTCVRTRTSTTNEFRIAVDSNCDAFIIDDISVVATSNPTVELLKDGGFEDFLYVTSIFGLGSVDDQGNAIISEELNNIQAGEVVAGVSVINVHLNGTNARIFFALYDLTDESLEGFKMFEPDKIIHGSPELTFANKFNIPENTGHRYEIKAMIWEKVEGYCGKALCPAFSLN